MHQPDGLVQREKAFGNIVGDEISLECVFDVTGVSFCDKSPRQMRAPDGVPGGFLNLVKIQDCSAVSPESFVDPVEDAPVSLPAERAKGREFYLERPDVVVDPVSEEVDVLVRVPHTRQFDPRHYLYPALSAGYYGFVNPRDAVVVAESDGAEADSLGHRDEFRRSAEPVGAGAVQVEIHGAIYIF
jgi:hypothetical protein